MELNRAWITKRRSFIIHDKRNTVTSEKYHFYCPDFKVDYEISNKFPARIKNWLSSAGIFQKAISPLELVGYGVI